VRKAAVRLTAALTLLAAALCGPALFPRPTALAQPAPAAPANPAAWEPWLHLPGVFDVDGPRHDGRLIVALATQLVLVTSSGRQQPFAPAYAVPAGSESYLVRSPGVTVDGAGCGFARDEVLALDLRSAPPGVRRISAAGAVTPLATVPGVTTLSGIALDTVGHFGHRLLVIGPAGPGQTRLSAVDCRGTVATVATVSAGLEGGMAVAPAGFGPFGGQLIAPDEVGGSIYAVSAAGGLSLVARSGVAAGGDIGVESAGFVPAHADVAYMADRGTRGNPHPGTDHLLRLRRADLGRAGIRAGDLLVGTEGGATVVRVRCAPACAASVVAVGPPTAHGEGRLLVVARRGKRTGLVLALIPAALILVAAGALAAGRARRVRHMTPE
jgi:hypothetical protein